MLKRKSQIHMLETIIVLVVFFILIGLGFIFYSKVFAGSIEDEKDEIAQLSAIKISQRASFLPELQCSENNIIKENCIDKLKLKAASAVMQGNEVHYFDKFGFSKITVDEIYPLYEEFLLYDYALEDYSSKIVTHVPISLFDPVRNKNAFGIMRVEVFVK